MKKSLTTSTSYDKYFYLTNSDYKGYSDYIYFCFEDNKFGLKYNNIKYCGSNLDPYNYPDNAIKVCSFLMVYYYDTQSSSGINRYCYKISSTNYFTYSIINYEGSYLSGSLYVISHYKDLAHVIKMTYVSINSRRTLPKANFENEYFYLTNSNYTLYSNYIYICLEDNNFGLNFNNIKYCCTNTNPYNYPEKAVSDCSFNSVPFYYNQNSSGTSKYFYKISITGSYSYSIVYYDGRNSSGSLYVTSDYKNLAPIIVKMTQVSRNLKTSLPTTTSENKYFYLINSNYSTYSSYIYICFEDNNFGLSYYNISYCGTNTNPSFFPEIAVNSCSFNSLSYYNTKNSSGTANIITRFLQIQILILIPLFIMMENILLEVFMLLVIIMIWFQILK